MIEEYTEQGLATLLGEIIQDESTEKDLGAADYPADYWRNLMIEGRQLSPQESWVIMRSPLELGRFRLASHQLIVGYHLCHPGSEVIFIPHIGADARAACFAAYDSVRHPVK